jgi:phosphoglycerate kinase
VSKVLTLDDVDVTGKRVLVRLDLNVPVKDGQVSDATRINRALPTLRELTEKGARVILLSHFGRPKGERVAEMSLEPIAGAVAARLGRPVAFAPDCLGPEAEAAVATLKQGEVLLLENTRFHAGEEKNDNAMAILMAKLGDFYVNDAFSAAHRAHASTEAIAHHLPAVAGRAMQAELKALAAVLTEPRRPVMAIIGGAKVSTKLDLLNNLVRRVNCLVIGGAMANTFLAAQGHPIGASLQERDLHDEARTILSAAQIAKCDVLLPDDAVVAREFSAQVPYRVCDLRTIANDEMILDVGPRSCARISTALESTRTVVWNGPLGAFEIPPFDRGTLAVAREVAARTKSGKLVSVAGGGDTVAALNAAGVTASLTYVSTAGGAFLEWLEGKTLPGVRALEEAARQQLG